MHYKAITKGGDNMTDSEKLDLILSKLKKLDSLESELQELKRHITSIELTLENETNRNIKLIAEGHLDLSHKLSEALKVDNEKEMLLIRVNILENEIRKIKERIESIA